MRTHTAESNTRNSAPVMLRPNHLTHSYISGLSVLYVTKQPNSTPQHNATTTLVVKKSASDFFKADSSLTDRCMRRSNSWLTSENGAEITTSVL